MRHPLRSACLALGTLAAAASLLFSAPASACGVDETSFERPVVQPVSSNAEALFAEARRLDGQATSLEMRAGEMDRRANAQAEEARSLRIEAMQSEGSFERSRLLDLANTMAASSIQKRAEARRLRDESTELRTEARLDRERASRIANVRPPGWRGRPVVLPVRDHMMMKRATDV